MSIGSIRKVFLAAVSIAIALFVLQARADDRNYTQGNVLVVTSVLTKPGMFDEYMKWLGGPFRQEQEELKKAGVVVEYGIFGTEPRHPGDPDLYLVVTYKNLAALDQLDAASETIEKKIYGSMKQANEGTASRESMRTILGTETIRELTLK